ncbi:MAG TPA: S-adenosylmethionine tRNA ribosyltransferase [Flavobacteriales bacterium]|jgi:S-adenosylmethionine:tRNA ribosyltransferase-isomerase|nr:S-adenosylmethionine tRNA ribosyltransferase [Flavobacteriales bacterium]
MSSQYTPNLEAELFDYELPEAAIALHPAEPRSAAKMLVWKKGQQNLNACFTDLPSILPQDSQLWVNNTRVIRARLLLQKPTGGRLEVFLLEPMGQSMEQTLASTAPVKWKCMVKGAKRWLAGLASLQVEDVHGKWELEAKRVGMDEGVRFIELTWTLQGSDSGEFRQASFAELLEAMGKMPLPPYMRRPEEAQDAEDYQTVYAEVPGSVAAPTAGLHFDAELMAELSTVAEVHNVTLHVGAGTFKPLGEGRIADHEMHGEKCTVSFDAIRALCSGGVHRVATGTTSLRTLESLYWLALKWKQDGIRPAHLDQWAWCNELASIDQELNWDMATAMQWCSVQLDGADWTFQTSIMIVPPYQIRSVQALITNFHLPNSTLLCLVAAAIGEDWKDLYASALSAGYRFLSFGDGSYLEWENKP